MASYNSGPRASTSNQRNTNVHPGTRKPSSSLSFFQRKNRTSGSGSWRNLLDAEAENIISQRPAIPSALRSTTGEAVSTPLPVLPMIVLSIVMLGEFLSANVSTPFMLFMVESFGGFNDESEVGYWTGILVSCFFITQFFTSLLWATAAERHGVRPILFTSLLGSSLTCFLFGTATSLPQAMCIRLLQGIFSGAIGVGRGNIAVVTDPTNEGRAYAILGFCWGFGGVAGAIIGGTFETPAKKWPNVFANVPIFVKYPYLLPTTIASVITFSGAIMALFLGPDGGPREGAIRLPIEKFTTDAIPEEDHESALLDDDELFQPQNPLRRLSRRFSKRFGGYFSRRVSDVHGMRASPSLGSPVVASGTPTAPIAVPSTSTQTPKARTSSRAPRASGSAYGYAGGSVYRKRLASTVSQSLAGRRGSLASMVARRRGLNVADPNTGYRYQDPETGHGARGNGSGPSGSSSSSENNLNFAQRLLMANEFGVTNIADLWVAAAINADNENPFESDSEFVEGEDGFDAARTLAELAADAEEDEEDEGRELEEGQAPARPGITPASPGSPGLLRERRPSSSSIPAIFSHVGVRTRLTSVAPSSSQSGEELGSINQNRPSSSRGGLGGINSPSHSTQSTPNQVQKVENPMRQLPLMIILQYGLLALHSTTHDQVFLSYLNSKYDAGGLGLNAGNFAQLIALMCLAQIAYQFYLYPNMGPPRGRFSHLSMFRLGSLLFIPSYLSVTLYHTLASPNDDGNVVLMAALALSNALRFCGSTFAYTAIAILLNYMSPPHILGLANGVAQSIVSLSRFCGPVIGGWLWSASVDGNPSGYPLGFFVCAGACSLAILTSFFIR